MKKLFRLRMWKEKGGKNRLINSYSIAADNILNALFQLATGFPEKPEDITQIEIEVTDRILFEKESGPDPYKTEGLDWREKVGKD